MTSKLLENKAFVDAIKEVENSVKAGFNKTVGRWFPHKSAEGGTDTLAYGHKLTKEEDKSHMVLVNGASVDVRNVGLTEEQATTLLAQDLSKALNTARSQWNGEYGKQKQFDDLDIKYQGVLCDLVFNVGTLMNKINPKRYNWPILSSYILDNNEGKVRNGMVRTYTTPQGKKVKLTKRRDVVADALGLAKG